MDKELEVLKEGPETKIHLDSLRAISPNQKKKPSSPNDVRRYLFQKFFSIAHRQAIEMNRCLEET